MPDVPQGSYACNLYLSPSSQWKISPTSWSRSTAIPKQEVDDDDEKKVDDDDDDEEKDDDDDDEEEKEEEEEEKEEDDDNNDEDHDGDEIDDGTDKSELVICNFAKTYRKDVFLKTSCFTTIWGPGWADALNI